MTFTSLSSEKAKTNPCSLRLTCWLQCEGLHTQAGLLQPRGTGAGGPPPWYCALTRIHSQRKGRALWLLGQKHQTCYRQLCGAGMHLHLPEGPTREPLPTWKKQSLKSRHWPPKKKVSLQTQCLPYPVGPVPRPFLKQLGTIWAWAALYLPKDSREKTLAQLLLSTSLKNWYLRHYS